MATLSCSCRQALRSRRSLLRLAEVPQARPANMTSRIFLMDRLALLILLVSVGAITLFVMLICPPKSRQCVTTGTLASWSMSYLVL